MNETMIGIELEKAIELMLSSITFDLAVEEVIVQESNGRIIAEDIISGIDVPSFDRSPLDGYAIKADDTVGASKDAPNRLKVIDEVFAGSCSRKILERGQAIRIMTGAPIPEGADCVIRQEDTDLGESFVEIYDELKFHENYCFRGEDILHGKALIKKGEKIRYTHQGIIASLGISSIKVKSKPKVALLVTGDELCPIGTPLPYGKIYDSNLCLISARLYELGIPPVLAEHVCDSGEMLANKISQVIEDVDLIITTGGVSVGKKDIVHDALPLLNADVIFWQVNFKPGSPAVYSSYKGKPILSLSGNPFAAITTFELLARPVLSKISSHLSLLPKPIKGVMSDDFQKKSPGRRFIRAIYQNGNVNIPPSGRHDVHSSGMIASMLHCNCLIDIKAGNKGLFKGDIVNIIML